MSPGIRTGNSCHEVRGQVAEGTARTVLAIAWLCASLVWVSLLAAAPWVAIHSRPGRVDFVLAGVVYRTGAVICHQRADRSFHLSGAQLPVCARCTGLYAGAPLGAILVLIASDRRRRSLHGRWPRVVLAASAVPTLCLWAGEWAGAIHPSDLMRAGWALPLGAAISALITAALLVPRLGDSVPRSGVN